MTRIIGVNVSIRLQYYIIMSTPKQNKIDTYAAELTNIAHVSIHQEELLKGIIKCIDLYKDRITTKQQLNKEHMNAMKQMHMKLKLSK